MTLKGYDKGRGIIDDNTRRELRRKQLCFTCKEPWNPSHKCMGQGQVHYIEVTSDDEEEDEYGQIQNMEAETLEATEEEVPELDCAAWREGYVGIYQWGTQVQHLQDERGLTRTESVGSD